MPIIPSSPPLRIPEHRDNYHRNQTPSEAKLAQMEASLPGYVPDGDPKTMRRDLLLAVVAIGVVITLIVLAMTGFF